MIESGSEHYKGGQIEPLELIEAQGMGPGFELGNVVKYATRAYFYFRGSMEPSQRDACIEAINKATWYLQRFKEIYLK